MKFTDICIRRPVLSTVLSIVILLLGIVAWPRLQVRQYPNVDEPKISIVTQLEGAGPEIIEAQITKILENALAGLEGLTTMTSHSEVGESKINLTFSIKRDIEAAANDVRDKIGRIRNKLPSDIQEPRIKKADADAFPFMHIVLYSDRHDVKDIADYASRYIENRLEAINGVSSVDQFGGGEYEMKLILDPVKLTGYHITANDVAAALKKQNLEKPAGNIISRDREINISIKADLRKEADFNNLVVGEHDGYLIRLSDVGHAELNAIDRHNRVLFNGQNAVAIGIVKQSVGNFINIAQDVKNLLKDIRVRLPHGMQIDVATDKTIFVKRSIDEVYTTLYIATALVILVIFLFLRSWRAVVIPIVTIPLSLIGTFALMYMFNFSINLLTLLALVLAIGLVVDDAIVMLENIYRHIENGMKPMQAAFRGAKEISFAVIAMTITLAAVYIPLALITGLIGKLFTEFALTLAGSVILSGFIALTLSPMMSGRLLKSHHDSQIIGTSWYAKFFASFERVGEDILRTIENSYERLLAKMLNRRWLMIGSGVIVSMAGYILFTQLPTELVPREDQGIVNARCIPPLGANLDYTARYMEQVDNIIKNVPEIVTRLAMISAPGESTSLNLLKPWEQRKRSSKEIVESLRDPLSQVVGLEAQPTIGGKSLVSGGVNDSPLEVVVMSNKTQKELIQIARRVMKTIGRIPGVYELWADFGAEGPEYVVTVDRDKAASLGVSIEEIVQTLDLIKGLSSSKFKKDSKIYQVKVDINDDQRKSPDDISALFVRSTKNKQESFVPLSEVIKIEKKMTPTEISHYMGFKSVTISGKVQSGYSLGEILDEVQTQAYQVVPEGTTIDFTGESRRLKDESQNIIMIFGLALVFIFLVLAAQYESWRDPWIIIFSVPLALAGGVFALKIAGQTSNLFSWIGFVTLIGLITKHGILIVDFANKLKLDGYTRLDAVLEASKLRLRPILMTTFAMVMGAVPLAFASGAGAESRQPIGWVIVGGMTLGTLFTLFIVPIIYTFISRKNILAQVNDESSNLSLS